MKVWRFRVSFDRTHSEDRDPESRVAELVTALAPLPKSLAANLDDTKRLEFMKHLVAAGLVHD